MPVFLPSPRKLRFSVYNGNDGANLNAFQGKKVLGDTGVTSEANLVTTVFEMEGINCSGCVKLILSHLEHYPGVIAVDVNIVFGVVRVIYDSNTVAVKDLLFEFEELGFIRPCIATSQSPRIFKQFPPCLESRPPSLSEALSTSSLGNNVREVSKSDDYHNTAVHVISVTEKPLQDHIQFSAEGVSPLNSQSTRNNSGAALLHQPIFDGYVQLQDDAHEKKESSSTRSTARSDYGESHSARRLTNPLVDEQTTVRDNPPSLSNLEPSIHNREAWLDLVIVLTPTGVFGKQKLTEMDLIEEKTKITSFLLSFKGIVKVQSQKEFLRVFYDPIWIGARYILSELQSKGHRTKHCRSLNLTSPWDVHVSGVSSSIYGSERTEGPAQRLFELSNSIKQKRKDLATSLLGLFLSLVLLCGPDEFGGFGNEPIFNFNHLRRPLIQFIIGLAVLLTSGQRWIQAVLQFSSHQFPLKITYLVGVVCCLGLILSFVALLIACYLQLIGIEPHSSIPTATGSVLTLLSLFQLGDLLTLSYAHEALTARTEVLGAGDVSQKFTSSRTELYRLIIRPIALALQNSEANSKAFFVEDLRQFLCKSGLWESQTTIDFTTQSTPQLSSLWKKSVDTVAMDIHQQLLQIGDIIVVETGQKFPVDGIVLERTNASREGSASFSIVSNFLLARGGAVGSINLLGPGDFIVAGEMNLGQPLLVRVIHIGELTTERQFENFLSLAVLWKSQWRPCLMSLFFKKDEGIQIVMKTILFFGFVAIGVLTIWNNVDLKITSQVSSLHARLNFFTYFSFHNFFSSQTWVHFVFTTIASVIRVLFCLIAAPLGLASSLPLQMLSRLCISRNILTKDPVRSLPMLAITDEVVLEKTGILSEGRLCLCAAGLIPASFVKAGVMDHLIPYWSSSNEEQEASDSKKNPQLESLRTYEEYMIAAELQDRDSTDTSILEERQQSRSLYSDDQRPLSRDYSQRGTSDFGREDSKKSILGYFGLLGSAARTEQSLAITPSSSPGVSRTRGDRLATRTAKRLGMTAKLFKPPDTSVLTSPLLAQRSFKPPDIDLVSLQSQKYLPPAPGPFRSSDEYIVEKTVQPLVPPLAFPYEQLKRRVSDSSNRDSQSTFPNTVARTSMSCLPEDLRIQERIVGPKWKMKTESSPLSSSTTTAQESSIQSYHVRDSPSVTKDSTLANRRAERSLSGCLPRSRLPLDSSKKIDSGILAAVPELLISRPLTPFGGLRTLLSQTGTSGLSLPLYPGFFSVRPKRIKDPVVGWILNGTKIDHDMPLDSIFALSSPLLPAQAKEVGRAKLPLSPRLPSVTDIRSSAADVLTHGDLVKGFWWLLWSIYSSYPNPVIETITEYCGSLENFPLPFIPQDVSVGLDGDYVCDICGLQVGLSSVSSVGIPQAKSDAASTSTSELNGEARLTVDANSSYMQSDSDPGQFRNIIEASLPSPWKSLGAITEIGRDSESFCNYELLREQSKDTGVFNIPAFETIELSDKPYNAKPRLEGKWKTEMQSSNEREEIENNLIHKQKNSIDLNGETLSNASSGEVVESPTAPAKRSGSLPSFIEWCSAESEVFKSFSFHELPSVDQGTANCIGSSKSTGGRSRHGTIRDKCPKLVSSDHVSHILGESNKTQKHIEFVDKMRREILFNGFSKKRSSHSDTVQSNLAVGDATPNIPPIAMNNKQEIFDTCFHSPHNTGSNLPQGEGENINLNERRKPSSRRLTIIDVLEARRSLAACTGESAKGVLERLNLTPKMLSDAQCVCEKPCQCKAGHHAAPGLALGSAGMSLAVAVNTPYFETLQNWNRRYQLSGHLTVFLHINNVCVGGAAFRDLLRPKASHLIQTLIRTGRDIWLCTNEDFVGAQEAAEAVGIRLTRVVCQAMPKDKLDLVLRISQNNGALTDHKRIVCFIGGRPADALGSISSDIGVVFRGGGNLLDSISDIVINKPIDLRDLEWLFSMSHTLRQVVRQNILISMLISLFAWCLSIVMGILRWPILLRDTVQILIQVIASLIGITLVICSTHTLRQTSRFTLSHQRKLTT